MVSINPLFIFWTIGCSISSWSKGCVAWCQSYWTRWCSLTGRVIGSEKTDSSWEFLRMENKQIKTVQNNSYGWNWLETTYFCVEVINSKRQLPFGVNVNLSLSDILCLIFWVWSNKKLCFILALPGLLILYVYAFHVTVIHCLLLLFLIVLSIYRVFYITLVLYLRRREKLKTVLKKTRCRFKIVYTIHQILHVVLCLVQKVNWL